ncbi:bifunctional methylenetetrahydrofolate dehydrogenase/methenyltetrahydrofolate cyclohydrolase FolD [Candidatus Falkowbacteria bacterium CG11_big_fil_rev_8_21_14_0_20_39_10]|uniref:Bifunctional protein FolD n=1 Tax=Candidatus Falkowbacteria bacterium CG11_big_fil_rev_8_21_14_0_20_39_10 TaxID=1974570 RepID=A0A2M6K7V2_9BACT|nr:MAG: bifunctional methylenetetrahydrofolate dehydrogenase/methenyltetrahydrofolate cyclohydrolase FolD [Candidatus Falkowbacteria bacterium CG11_big_fil_rev_8_21_14_0_20_39_10]
MVKVLDGKKLSQKIKNDLKREIKNLSLKPGLAIVLVGQNPASKIYVKQKSKIGAEIGIKTTIHKLPSSVAEKKLLELINKLNKNKNVHGIIVQLPLPKRINPAKVIKTIDPKKDVDGFHPLNAGNLFLGQKSFVPATPAGIMELLNSYKIKIAGRHSVVVGRSNIVGKPIALLLLEKNATVTICHSQTKNLSQITHQADILISAVGQPNLIKKNMIKKGVVIIDVGINRLGNKKIVGDVDFKNCKSMARAITPVPNGVGPMTIAMLMKNCVEAAKNLK